MGERDPNLDWNDDQDNDEPAVSKAASLVALFEKSWHVITSALDRWTSADLEKQLQRDLKGYVDYFNRARPHQGIQQQIPEPPTKPLPPDPIYGDFLERMYQVASTAFIYKTVISREGFLDVRARLFVEESVNSTSGKARWRR